MVEVRLDTDGNPTVDPNVLEEYQMECFMKARDACDAFNKAMEVLQEQFKAMKGIPEPFGEHYIVRVTLGDNNSVEFVLESVTR